MQWFSIYILLYIHINLLHVVQGTDENQNFTFVHEIRLTICQSILRACSANLSSNETIITFPGSEFDKDSENIEFCKGVVRAKGFELKFQGFECNETIESYVVNKNTVNFTVQETDERELKKKFHSGYFHTSNPCFFRVLDATDRIEKACSNNSMREEEEGPEVKLRKCCPPGEVIKLDANDPKIEEIFCVATNESEEWYPYFYKNSSKNKFKERSSENPNIKYETGIPVCKISNSSISIFTPSKRAFAPLRAEIRVTESGAIYIRASGNHPWEVPKINKEEIKHICIDGLIESQSGSMFHKSEYNQVLIHCNEKTHKLIEIWWYAHVVVRVLIGLILLILIVVLALLWDEQTIHAWTAAFYSLSMLFFIIFNSAVDNLRVHQKIYKDVVPLKSSYTACFVIGVLTHFFSMARFSWNTIVNFDMWSTIIYRIKAVESRKEKKRFLCYLGFGFGIPAFVIAISLFMEFQFEYFDDTVVRPQYGNKRCNLDKSATLYYEIILSVCLFLTGILITGLTFKFIRHFMKKAKESQHFTERSHRYRMAQLFTKIYFLLAFSRIFEIGGLVWYYLEQKTISWHIVLFDVFYLVESVGFFWLFVCTPETRKQLCTKYTRMEAVYQWIEKIKWKNKILNSSNNAN